MQSILTSTAEAKAIDPIIKCINKSITHRVEIINKRGNEIDWVEQASPTGHVNSLISFEL
jgi:hypothetical protein